MRDFRLLFAGIVSGGFWSRLFAVPDTLGPYLVVCALVWAAVELVAYLARHVRWEG